jgi:hypothetical protein
LNCEYNRTGRLENTTLPQNPASSPTPQPDPNEMIHCNPDVKKQIESVLSRARAFGMSYPDREFGFTVEQVDGQIKVGSILQGEGEIRYPVTTNTIAYFHTHPISRRAYPSGKDINAANGNTIEGTIKQKHINYVYAINEGVVNSALYNGNRSTTSNGKPRVITPAECPKKK